MTEIENLVGQTLLRVVEEELHNHIGQTIATIAGGDLVNLQRQVLATADADGAAATLSGGARVRVDGDEIVGPSESVIGKVRGGDAVERALAAAAFMTFCCDG